MGLLLECEPSGDSAVVKKASRFPFPLPVDYFDKPCTTAAVKKLARQVFVR